MSEKEKNENNEQIKKEEKVENIQEKEMQKLKQELDDITDRYKRILAEFENHKKRSQKERDNLYNLILGDIVEVMLPILDNLENAAKIETKDEEYKKGRKEGIVFLGRRYLLNGIIVIIICTFAQLLLNVISIGILQFLVR